MPRIPRTLVGFAVINGATFALDLTLVSLLHGRWHVPLALAVTVGYAVALGLGFVLNRRFTFRSRARVGPQTVRYVAVVAVNFTVVLLGVTTLLAALGTQYQLARVVAGLVEGGFVYVAMRWFVFAGAPSGSPAEDPVDRDRVSRSR